MYETKAYDTKGSEWTVEEVDDSDVFFSPERGNVAFASTGDGWGFRLVFFSGSIVGLIKLLSNLFRIHQFADLYAKKLNMQRRLLMKTLWGDHYLVPKSKKILSKDPTGNSSPMFVQFILKNIWDVYNAVEEQYVLCLWSSKYAHLPLQEQKKDWCRDQSLQAAN